MYVRVGGMVVTVMRPASRDSGKANPAATACQVMYT
jgi:hypothetical protein